MNNATTKDGILPKEEINGASRAAATQGTNNMHASETPTNTETSSTLPV
jgi:hypothetical protein